MNAKLFKLLIGMLFAIVVGFFCQPILFPHKAKIVKNQPTQTGKDSHKPQLRTSGDDEAPMGVEIDTVGLAESSDFAEGEELNTFGSSTEDPTYTSSAEEYSANIGEPSTESYFVADTDEAEELPLIIEEQVIAIGAKEEGCPPASDFTRKGNIRRAAQRMAGVYLREEKRLSPNTKIIPPATDLSVSDWQNIPDTRKMLMERMFKNLGKIDKDEALFNFLETRANRLDLARVRLIQLAGAQQIADMTKRPAGAKLITDLCNNLEWITGLLYSGPSHKMGKALENLLLITERNLDCCKTPIGRRIATTTAIEAAQQNWDDKATLERFGYYYGSWTEGKLNTLFDDLQYWDTRLVTGCGQNGFRQWGSARNLTWMRDNVRLPLEGYTGAGYQMSYRLRNVAGDSVHGGDYLAPMWKYTNDTRAWAHREIGGVCGAISHYGTYGALAQGLPAITMGEPGHCAYAVRIGDEWIRCNSIYWQHSMHKVLWGEHAWDFLCLMQGLYSERHQTLVSDQLLALADTMASQGMQYSAVSTYEAAANAQPLNWPAWLAYCGYLKNKVPNSREHWLGINKQIVEGMGSTYHNAAATLLYKYVYPYLLPQLKDKREVVKVFTDFFRQCDTMGNNRWDVSNFLTAQLKTCTTLRDQREYMKSVLRTLMLKPAYAGAALSWGLDYISSLPDNSEGQAAAEEFTDTVVFALSRARTTKKNIDSTWNALGEAIYTASENKDRRIFQAIGKIAYKKCKKNFPRNKFRFRGFSGSLVSMTGRIETAATIDPDGSCNLHWAVLQKDGGSMPGKFEGSDGLNVELEKTAEINGVVCLFAEGASVDAVGCKFTDAKVRRNQFILDVSLDGQNWEQAAVGQYEGTTVRFATRKERPKGKYLRVRRKSEFKLEGSVVGFYAYGKYAR